MAHKLSSAMLERLRVAWDETLACENCAEFEDDRAAWFATTCDDCANKLVNALAVELKK